MIFLKNLTKNKLKLFISIQNGITSYQLINFVPFIQQLFDW
jgi:hypothetical protein